MILTGAGRSIGVKLFYQMGYNDPLFVAALYLLGQTLSLVVYWFTKCCYRSSKEEESQYELVASNTNGKMVDEEMSDTTVSTDDEETDAEEAIDSLVAVPQRRQQLKRQGSDHGLTEESTKAVSWVHEIPWYFKPAIPGVFNLLNAALRWASYVYVPASVAEMLIAGSELTLSVVAARLIRKRLVSYNRWMGVGIVSTGLLLISFAHLAILATTTESSSTTTTTTTPVNHHTIGNILILGQSLMSVSQDITEEIFLHEAEFPATLLLGMEGLYGLILVGLLSFIVPKPSQAVVLLAEDSPSSFLVKFSIGLVLVFTVTGIFNILTTEATSSMTRNVWKNSRTLLVWILGLIIYYSTNNEELGEGWLIPDSYIILIGYLIMLGGIVVYYK